MRIRRSEPQTRHAAKIPETLNPMKPAVTKASPVPIARKGKKWRKENINVVHTAAENPVIAANVATGIRSKPAETYAGKRVPGTIRLKANASWPRRWVKLSPDLNNLASSHRALF